MVASHPHPNLLLRPLSCGLPFSLHSTPPHQKSHTAPSINLNTFQCTLPANRVQSAMTSDPNAALTTPLPHGGFTSTGPVVTNVWFDNRKGDYTDCMATNNYCKGGEVV